MLRIHENNVNIFEVWSVFFGKMVENEKKLKVKW